MTIGSLPADQQQLNVDPSATSDAFGNAEFVFPAVPVGSTWTGTLLCGAAPVTAVFSAFVGGSAALVGSGTPWGSWGGNSVYGPVQAHGAQVLTVTATGLAPHTTYLLGWRGRSEPSITADLVYPEANSTALTAEVSGTLTLPVVTLLNTTDNLNSSPIVDTFVMTSNVQGFRVILEYGALVGSQDVTILAQDTVNSNRQFQCTVQVPNSATTPPFVSVAIPLAAAQGASIEFTISAAAITASTTNVLIEALGAAPSTTTAPGQPIESYPVGGAEVAVAAFNANTVPLLGAPPAGMAYRLQRLVTTNQVAGSLTNVVGATSGNIYLRIPVAAAVDNGEGLLAQEALEVSSAAGSGNAILFYDLIALPSIE